ncbi:MAG: DUF5702 domain-containing protein [Lachnospiraceae bacterium]
MKKGEITAFLSLILIIIVAFIGALIESASIQIAKNNKRGEAEGALYSVFAEYQKELLEEYDIFGLEGTYETGKFTKQLICDRMDYYGGAAMDHNIKKIQLLTDDSGMGLREQIIRYMQSKIGIHHSGVPAEQWTPVWEEQSAQGENTRQREDEINRNLQTELEGVEGGLPEENNPLTNVEALKQSSLLELILPKNEQVSNQFVLLEEQPSIRELEKGYGDFPIWKGVRGIEANLMVGEYILEHFSTAADREEHSILLYELEYILEGKASDRENLEAVVQKLMVLRTGANYAYLQTDIEKQMEAGALALTLSSVLALPPLTEAVKQAILAAWAYGESIMDMRSLLTNRRVPLIKTRESWQLQLENLLTIGTETDVQEGQDFENGQTYRDYLRMLLFLENQETSITRSMDLIEGNLKKIHGLGFFQIDHCISKMEFEHQSKIFNGVTYTFPSYYGYQ